MKLPKIMRDKGFSLSVSDHDERPISLKLADTFVVEMDPDTAQAFAEAIIEAVAIVRARPDDETERSVST